MIRQCYQFIANRNAVRNAIVGTPFVRKWASRFIAGETLDSAAVALHDLQDFGIKTTLNYAGAHFFLDSDVDRAANAAIAGLSRIHTAPWDANISIKLTQIGLDLNEDCCRGQLRRILGRARDLGIFVWIDAEESRYFDVATGLFCEMRAEFGTSALGIVAQSYLRGRRNDLERMVRLGARIRLVKGGYWEPPDIAYRSRTDIDKAFRVNMELLLASGNQPAIATHDLRCIEHALEWSTAAGIPPQDFEFQMLYGVRPGLQRLLAAEGYAVRCYLPYGPYWYAYFLGCARRAAAETLRHAGRREGEPAVPITRLLH